MGISNECCAPLAVLSMGSCVFRAWVYGDPLAAGDLGNSFECMAHKDTLGDLFLNIKLFIFIIFLTSGTKQMTLKGLMCS